MKAHETVTDAELARLRSLLTYDPSDGEFRWRVRYQRAKAGQIAGGPHNMGYRQIRLRPSSFLAHRLAWLFVHGCLPPPGMQIDHINGDRSDNRITNPRLATQSQNSQNGKLRAVSKTGFKGVFRLSEGKYRASITVDYRTIHIGVYATAQEAYSAYVGAAAERHGEFARLA